MENDFNFLWMWKKTLWFVFFLGVIDFTKCIFKKNSIKKEKEFHLLTHLVCV